MAREQGQGAGDRDRAQRLKARRLLSRLDRWEMPDDDGRAHRRSRRGRVRRPR